MKLSVIIVNYNVQYFVEQCLHAVQKATKDIDAEIIVVDNNSVDGSVAMIKEKFPTVQLIENKTNSGFSVANNQAIKIARGEYVLLLNPDTVVEEDTFTKTLRFMDEHSDAGALGVKMLDGKGHFLPESKRGLPTPLVAFYKMFGLSKLFPKSRVFGKYHLGYLDKEAIHSVEILSGAFMMIRKKVLDEIGLLDETFFMYGEDIDLSWRIIKAGYKNYYFPETRIIHYKGESTKKSSVNYVLVFYNAMIIFARKHFSEQNAVLFSFLINLTVYLRAGFALLSRFIKRASLPLFDTGLLFGGIYLIKNYYEQNFKFTDGGYYPPEFIRLVVPAYIFVWLFSVFISGGYDKPVKLQKIIRGLLFGTGLILVIYALLPENYRFSRALILLGATWAHTVMLTSRLLFHFLKLKDFSLDSSNNKRIVVVGNEEECDRVTALIKQSNLTAGYVGKVSPNQLESGDFVGDLSQLTEIIEIYKINEVVFCAKDLSSQIIIDQMSRLGKISIDFKIAPPESLSIIGSNSINTSGELYVIDINSVSKPANRRNKRMIDIGFSCLLLILFPLAIFFIKRPFGLIKNIFLVGFGNKTWVGYYSSKKNTSRNDPKLPRLKSGVVNPADILQTKNTPLETTNRLNMLYAKDYSPWNDIHVILKAYKKLGRS